MENYRSLIQKQRDFFSLGKTKNVSFRKQALIKLRSLIQTHEKDLMACLKADLNKSEFDSYSTEIGIVLEELKFTIKNIEKWAKPTKVKTPMTLAGSKSFIYPEPYGVVLVIAPWNYPFQLAVAPLIGAIAAGNCSILKPSELTPATSRLLADLIGNNFSEEFLAVVEGGVETSQALLGEKVDYIFFTGSVAVGRIVMQAAAKTLTPVTLELGGKSPCIVHHDANLKHAAKRIAWGKYMNAGQTCVAPDYLFIHSSIKIEFLRMLKEAVNEIYTNNPIESGTFSRVVSERHFNRLVGFLDDGEKVFGGRYNSETLAIEPTALEGVSWESPVMEDEIFGPIMPVMEYENLSDMIVLVNNRPKPLALYLFSEGEDVQQQVLTSISFGGGCINDTIMHLSSPYLPFGGVGESGMGAYHGKGSFEVFSHKKSILKQTTKFDLPFRYPNKKDALKKIKLFIK